MIVQVKELPERARRPLLVALSLQALATRAASSGKDVGEAELARFTLDFASVIEEAHREELFERETSSALGEYANPTKLKDIADRVWTLGLTRLQQLVAEGEWYPDELDLLIKPREEPLLSRDHLGQARKRDGSGKLGFHA